MEGVPKTLKYDQNVCLKICDINYVNVEKIVRIVRIYAKKNVFTIPVHIIYMICILCICV